MGSSNSVLKVLDNVHTNNKVHVQYINLDARLDRRAEIEAELNGMNLEGIRVPAIRYDPGQIGCTLSHIKALEQALLSDADHYLIFEDDFVRTADSSLIHHILKAVMRTDYDVFMLGYCIFEKVEESLFRTSHSMFKRIKHACCSHGYMVNKRYASKLLNNLRDSVNLRFSNPKPQYNLDEHWKTLQQTGKWLCYAHGALGVQREGYSDIDKKVHWDAQSVQKSLGQ